MTKNQIDVYNCYTKTVDMGIALCIYGMQDPVKLIDQYVDQILKDFADTELQRKCLEYLYQQRNYYKNGKKDFKGNDTRNQL